jgi:hypothetical protein
MTRIRFNIFSMFVIGFLTIVTNAQTNTMLRGSVFDPSGDAVIPGVTVVVRGNGVSEKVQTNADGEFSFRLPKGEYEITSEHPHYFPIRRSLISLSATEPTILNLYPSLRVLSIALVATRKGVIDEYSYARSPKFTRLSQPQRGPRDGAVVEFNTKVRRRGSTTYQVVKITSGSLTIMASELIVTPTRVEARGNVLVDNNGEKTRFSSYIVN